MKLKPCIISIFVGLFNHLNKVLTIITIRVDKKRVNACQSLK